MPSPFPGMDPYLEDSRLWEGFHNRLIGILDEILTLRIPPGYYVEQQSSVYIIDPGGIERSPIKPDVYLVEAGRSGAVGPSTALLERPITAPTVVSARFPEEIRQRFLEVRDATSHRVVTIIEVLSPTNKAPGAGREAFLRKQREVMASPTHWLEIDLLRVGERPVEVAGQSDYYALLQRGGELARYEIWFCNLRDVLPVVAVPLTPMLPDVALDLQVALGRIYDLYYAERLTYDGEPSSRLAPADAAWASERVGVWRAAREAAG